MNIVTIITALCLTIFSTAVMSYISMAIPIGPWIETTVVLIALLIFRFFTRYTQQQKSKGILLSTASAGIGGILATGLGFSFPTLYFLDKALFTNWLSSPLYFIAAVSSLALVSGGFGLVVAEIFEYKLIYEEKMPFVIGQLIQKVVEAQQSMRQAINLMIGFIGTTIFLYVQSCLRVISQQITFISSYTIGNLHIPTIGIRTDMFPMFWSIGFVTGHLIAIPLLVGLVSKIFFIDPFYYWYSDAHSYLYILLHQYIFPYTNYVIPASAGNLSSEDFTMAFASGMVLYGAIVGLLGTPKVLYKSAKQLIQNFSNYTNGSSASKIPLLECVIVVICNTIFFSYFKFSFIAQLYLAIVTFVCTYQLLVIAGKIGIAPLGRFATFVMVPYIFIFGSNAIHITFISAFVEIAGGVACDVLFGRKMAELASITHKEIKSFQLFGLLVSSLSIGIIFWFLIMHFGLGTAGELPVNKAYGRALLVSLKNFDVYCMLFGCAFGYLLTRIKVNPTLALGGILMPINYSLMLVLGGLSTYLVRDKESYYPLCSGMFAANSLWMIMRTIIKTVC